MMNDELFAKIKSSNASKDKEALQAEVAILKNSIVMLTDILNKLDKENRHESIVEDIGNDRWSMWKSIKNLWK